MPGMSTGLRANNPTIVSAFHAELVRQGLVVLLIAVLLAVAWNILRSVQLRRGSSMNRSGPMAGSGIEGTEPIARRLLRVSFGLLWIFDGFLQAQASMPLGMAPQVLQPSAAASSSWVQHLDNAMATIWSYHPIVAPAAAVWIQIGIGTWLLVARRGAWSRFAGVSSVAWGLVVWVFGEAFGGVFAPGLTWLFGAPGAVLFYCVAGGLIALPERAWVTPKLGRRLLAAMGGFFIGMAVLQSWPGRGFWQGQVPQHAIGGTLTGMVDQMAQTPQPHLISTWVAAFASFDAAHGWAVNLFVVIFLAGVGLAFLSGRPRLVLGATIVAVIVCLADWVLIEDLGFMGGVGTDPNSMIPMALVFVAGYLGLVHPAQLNRTVVALPPTSRWSSWWDGLRSNPTYALRSIAALGAVAVVLVGALPMAVAAGESNADPILAQAATGPIQAIDVRASAFSLIDQRGRSVSLASLRGKVIALTFLDPVCTSDCPLIAQYFRLADDVLGAERHRVELIAIDANPRFTAADYLNAFDREEGMNRVPNWLYLTGSTKELKRVWRDYGIVADVEPAGAMIAHSEFAFVIDSSGRIRYTFGTSPGPASESTQSSFSVLLANAIQTVLAH
jgi:cytochrome oxidase Cu insertion factor (SCO1/SenC/PrrC family)